MKKLRLNIINSKGNTVSLRAIQPKTVEEMDTNLGTAPADAMICFPLAPEVCIQPFLFECHRHTNLDVLSIDWIGNIKFIHHNVAPEERLILHPDAVCIIKCTANFCKKHDIASGDSLIHKHFYISSDNTVVIQGQKLKKISLDILRSIKPQDIQFIEKDSNLIRRSAILATKTNELYYVDYSPDEYKTVFDQIASKYNADLL